MKPFRWLQEQYGFTQREIAVLLFLCVTFLAGSALRWFRQQHAADPSAVMFDYAGLDSEFAARAQSLFGDTAASPPARKGAGAQGTGESRTKKAPAAGSIDINSASLEELTSLPGIGGEMARRIAEYRTAHGPFASAEDLLDVKGIGPKKLEKIRPFIRLGQSPPPAR
jgi:comEA protein